MPLGLHSFFC